ncbi:hypothetical protein V1478_011246 [Vespula squamosa]|uniref:Uncharacterized protein n=1 Tax=Vespula squamosa TaxID=30214 RepID=A0ABD2ADZ0_VESSQ
MDRLKAMGTSSRPSRMIQSPLSFSERSFLLFYDKGPIKLAQWGMKIANAVSTDTVDVRFTSCRPFARDINEI